MVGELDVLGIVSRRLTDLRIDFMLTGSFAMAFYATPRMTRDIDVDYIERWAGPLGVQALLREPRQ